MDTFFRRGANRSPMPIDKARQELLGQDAPSSPQRTSPILRFPTIARRGESLPAKAVSKHRLQSPEPQHWTQSQPTSPLDSPARVAARLCRSRAGEATRLALSSDFMSNESFQEPCLAHPRGGCACAVAQVATMTGSQAWKVMGMRFKARHLGPSDSLRDAHRPVGLSGMFREGRSVATPAPHHRLEYSIPGSIRTPPAPPAGPRACCDDPPRVAVARETETETIPGDKDRERRWARDRDDPLEPTSAYRGTSPIRNSPRAGSRGSSLIRNSPRVAHRRVMMRSDASHFPRRGAPAKRLPFPSPRKVDIKLPGKGNSNSYGARPVY